MPHFILIDTSIVEAKWDKVKYAFFYGLINNIYRLREIVTVIEPLFQYYSFRE